MKIFLSIIVIISIVFLRCSEESNPIDNANDGSFLVTGKVSNFSGNFNKVYASGFPHSDSLLKIESEIKADGSFNLKIPIPSMDHLSQYTPVNRVSVINGDSIIFIDSLQIADNNLKYNRYNLFAQSLTPITYALSINLAKLNSPSELAKVGDYYISYYYFNSNSKIQGYYKLRMVASDSSREFITEFNVNTKIGWNKVITKFKSEENNKSIYEVTDIAVDKGDWIIGASDSFSNGVWKF